MAPKKANMEGRHMAANGLAKKLKKSIVGFDSEKVHKYYSDPDIDIDADGAESLHTVEEPDTSASSHNKTKPPRLSPSKQQGGSMFGEKTAYVAEDIISP